MFNQATWQRVWAAKSVKDMRRGFAGGSFLVFLLMMFFGIMGMIAYANDPEAYNNFDKYACKNHLMFYDLCFKNMVGFRLIMHTLLFSDLAFFDLLAPLNNVWHIIVLIAVTGLAASSLDSLQTAIASILSSDIIRFGVSDNTARFLTRLILILINIPAVILSSYRFDVIGLFLVADLVCGTAVLPVFLGLITEDIGIIPAPTELGAFLGIISGIAAVVVNGHIIGFDQAVSSITGEVIASGPFSYFWLTNSSECAVCGTTTMVTFIVVPLVAGFCTLLFSKIDIMIRGNRARKPLFGGPQPGEYGNYHFDKQETMSKHVDDGEEESEEFDADDNTNEEERKVVSDDMEANQSATVEETAQQAQNVTA